MREMGRLAEFEALAANCQRLRFRAHGCLFRANREYADDVVQRALLITWRDIDKVKAEVPLACYALGVLRKAAGEINISKKNSRCRHESLDKQRSLPAAPPYDPVKVERMKILREAIDTLRNSDREVLTRFYFDEHAKEDIAADMGVTLDQLRLLKSRALVKVQVKMGTCRPKEPKRYTLAEIQAEFKVLSQGSAEPGQSNQVLVCFDEKDARMKAFEMESEDCYRMINVRRRKATND